MTELDDELLTRTVRVLRVLGLALIAGTLAMTGVLVGLFYFVFGGKPLVPPGPNGIPLITAIGLAVAVPTLLLSVIVPGRMRAAARTAARPGSGVEIGRYSGAMIVGMALAEAPALMGAIFFLMEGHWLSLLPVGFGVLLMIWKQPTEAAIREWTAAPAE
jgi:hypothetical protein